MANNFYSFIDNDPHHSHRSKSDNIRIKINDEADKVIKQLCIHLEIILRKCGTKDIVFDCFRLLHYKCHKINPNCGGPYIHSTDWIRNKKAIKYLNNKKDNKCFQCFQCVKVALNHEEIKNDLQKKKKKIKLL